MRLQIVSTASFYIDVFNELPAKTTYPGFMETIAQCWARGGIKVKLLGDSQQYENGLHQMV